MPSLTTTVIERVTAGISEQLEDTLATEEPLEIRLVFSEGGQRLSKPISITMRTPGNDADLATGFLFTEGIIQDPSEIASATPDPLAENKIDIQLAPLVQFDWQKLERHFYTSSSCGVCGKSSIDSLRSACRLQLKSPQWQVASGFLMQLPDMLRKAQELFESTGGLHASALYDTNGHLLLLREDVGRHNALDKVIGAALQQNLLPLENHILLLSGRASFELLQKAAMAGIKMVCAVGAPSSLAVELAKEFDITLVGFLKANKFNIYAAAKRVQLSQEMTP